MLREVSIGAPAAETLDRRGARRSPVTFAEFRQGQPARNKGMRLPAEPLTGAEVYALLDACTGRAASRNRALIFCFWRSGLRCAEALALRPKDVDLDAGRITVLHGKGNKRRVVALDEEACYEVWCWAEDRAELGISAADPLFCVMTAPTTGYPLNSMYVRDLLKRLAVKADVQKRVHPHGLRHTYASYLLGQGVPVHYIRRMLGHTSLAITERYCDHLNPFEAAERVRGVRWPERLAA